MSTIDLEKLTKLDPADVYNYVVQFDPKNLEHEDILAIFLQISAFDLLNFYLFIGAPAYYADYFFRRIATIDAYEFALICHYIDRKWLWNAKVKFYESDQIFNTDYGRMIHNAETIEYWQDLQKTFTSFEYCPKSNIRWRSIHGEINFKLDEYFGRFSFPTNQLVIFATKQPGFVEKYSQLSPELQAKYCHPKDISQHFSFSLPQHIRLGLLMRLDNLQDFLQSIPIMSLSALERKFIEASNNAYTQLPQVIVDKIESLLCVKNDELYIVRQIDLVKRFLLKRAIMRDLEYVIIFANTEDLKLLPNSMVVFEKICLLRQDLDFDVVSHILRNYANLSQDQLFLLMKNQKISVCSNVVKEFMDKFGVTRRLVDFLIDKHLPGNLRFIKFSRWDLQSKIRYIEANWSQIAPIDIGHIFFTDMNDLIFKTCELCFESVKIAFKNDFDPIYGIVAHNQQVCSYLCNKFPDIADIIFHQFSRFGQHGTDLFPLANNANFKKLFYHNFDDAEDLIRRIVQEKPDLQSNIAGAYMSDANVLIWLDYCKPEYVAEFWSSNEFSKIVEKLPNTSETLRFVQIHFEGIKHNTEGWVQVFPKMEAKDIVQVLVREDFPRVPRYKMFMQIVNEGNTKVIDMLFVPEFAFLLNKAKDRLVAINPEYAAKIDAVSSRRPMINTFGMVKDQFYHLDVD